MDDEVLTRRGEIKVRERERRGIQLVSQGIRVTWCPSSSSCHSAFLPLPSFSPLNFLFLSLSHHLSLSLSLSLLLSLSLPHPNVILCQSNFSFLAKIIQDPIEMFSLTCPSVRTSEFCWQRFFSPRCVHVDVYCVSIKKEIGKKKILEQCFFFLSLSSAKSFSPFTLSPSPSILIPMNLKLTPSSTSCLGLFLPLSLFLSFSLSRTHTGSLSLSYPQGHSNHKCTTIIFPVTD